MVFVAAPFRKLSATIHIFKVFPDLSPYEFYLQKRHPFLLRRHWIRIRVCIVLNYYSIGMMQNISHVITSKSFVNSHFAAVLAYYWYSNRSGRNSNGIIPNIFLVSRTNFISSLVYPLSSKESHCGIALR
jgi:hypothetical protein